jgi:hypothetical protein
MTSNDSGPTPVFHQPRRLPQAELPHDDFRSSKSTRCFYTTQPENKKLRQKQKDKPKKK